MGISNTSNPNRINPASSSRVLLYVLPVLSGCAAVFAGDLALQRPVAGVCMLACVLASYIAASALLISVIEPARRVAASPRRTALRLVADRTRP
jgi:hypothetical protein